MEGFTVKFSLIILMMLSFSGYIFSQFESIYEAEDYVLGEWVQYQEPNNSGFSITITNVGHSIIFLSEHRFIQNTGDAFGNKKIEGKWEVERNEYGEYVVRVETGGWLKIISRYRFDGLDYLIDDWRVKYRRK